MFAVLNPPRTGVFLFEDHKIAQVGFLLPENARKVSTHSFLLFLEQRGWLGACRTFRAGRVESQSGRMQGAARRQWLFHCQASQRRRRRFGLNPPGRGRFLAQGCVATRLFGMTKPRIVAPCPAPKSPRRAHAESPTGS